MRVSRIHVDTALQPNGGILLPDQTAHYVKHVLRLKPANEVILFDGQSQNDYTAQIKFSGKQVFAKIISFEATHTESPVNSTLIQALGKPDHMDFLVQKSTELGINKIAVFNSQHTQLPLKPSRLEKKLSHWKKISISACEQCGRSIVPDISFHDCLLDSVDSLSDGNRVLLDFDGSSWADLSVNLCADKPFSMLAGAEGGLSQHEIDLAKCNGFSSCMLGPRVLRMETAGIAMLSLIQQRFGDL